MATSRNCIIRVKINGKERPMSRSCVLGLSSFELQVYSRGRFKEVILATALMKDEHCMRK